MANPYIVSSKLTREEVECMVDGLVAFSTYGEIAETLHRTPQAVRPVLTRIERRMYFELDTWPLFHMMQLSNYNLNRDQIPYENEIQHIIECVLRIPRGEGKSGMRIRERVVSFDAEIACLFNCPQHLPPSLFVERYGKANPIQNFNSHPLEQECNTRIGLKRSCGPCKSNLRDLLAFRSRRHFFRFAMEYAQRFGKPKPQYADLFIARMAYYLVWRAFSLNARHFFGFQGLVHMGEVSKLPREQRRGFIREMYKRDNDHFIRTFTAAKKAATGVVLKSLLNDPIRVDRRGVHTPKAKSG